MLIAILEVSDDTIWLYVGAFTALVLGGTALRALLRARASRSWPTAEGKILSGRAKCVSGESRSYWFAELTYTFTTADGSYYAGRFEESMGSEAAADEYVRKLKDGKVLVRYKPNDPDTSLATPL